MITRGYSILCPPILQSRKHPDGGPVVPTRQICSANANASGSASAPTPKKQPVVRVKAVKPPKPPRPPYVRPPRKPKGVTRIVTQEEVDNAVKAGLKVAYSLRGNPLIYDINCDDCDRYFATKSALRQHRSVQHPTDEQLAAVEANCSNCQMNFDYAVSLNSHLMRCLPTNDLKDFSCGECETSWYSGTALRKHISEAHGIITNVCHVCGSIIKSKAFLKEHIAAVHGGSKEYRCFECPKPRFFASQLGLTSHHQNVHGPKNFPCNFCDKRYSTNYKLTSHQNQVHLKPTKFQCGVCNFSCYRKEGLRAHICE